MENKTPNPNNANSASIKKDAGKSLINDPVKLFYKAFGIQAEKKDPKYICLDFRVLSEVYPSGVNENTPAMPGRRPNRFFNHSSHDLEDK